MHNNYMHEWGRNCATLLMNEGRAKNCMDSFGEFGNEDRTQFWEGFNMGPREPFELVPISPNVVPYKAV